MGKMLLGCGKPPPEKVQEIDDQIKNRNDYGKVLLASNGLYSFSLKSLMENIPDGDPYLVSFENFRPDLWESHRNAQENGPILP